MVKCRQKTLPILRVVAYASLRAGGSAGVYIIHHVPHCQFNTTLTLRHEVLC